MKLRVNKDKCEVIENEIWNVGDYHVKTVQVELSDDFNGLVNKVRYFVDEDCYDMIIDNNVAQIPYEVTKQEGVVKIGVYGFDVDTNVLVQSTSPIIKYITRGTYTGDATNTEPLTPTDKQQMEMQIQENKESIEYLEANKQDKLVSGENIKTINHESILGEGNIDIAAAMETDPIFTHSPAYTITNQDITYWNNKSDFSGSYNDLTDKPTIPDVSNFVTKDVNDLTYYTTTANLARVALSGSYNDLINAPDISGFATTTDLGNETTARENADINLQSQIDAITSASDVKDVVGTYTDLQNYDTTTLGNNDIVKVLEDSTHNNAMTYYRWVIASGFGEWEYIGQEGAYYTKSETDTLLNAKQNEIDASHKLSSDLVDDTNNTNLFVTSTEKTTWNGKQNALTAGTNITITNNTISATDTTYSDATTTTSGLMSASDKTKLNGIASGAEVNVQSNWNESDISSDSYIQNKPSIASNSEIDDLFGVDLPTDSVYLLKTSNWTDPYCFAWNGSSQASPQTWPGTAMTDTGYTYNNLPIYKFTVDTSLYNKCIFSNNGANQTSDLTSQAGKVYNSTTNEWLTVKVPTTIDTTKLVSLGGLKEYNETIQDMIGDVENILTAITTGGGVA